MRGRNGSGEPMRQVVLDTETTGLEVQRGHRIIEIGCVELAERRPTGRTFHAYLNPDRSIDEGARAVSGISDEFLSDKPRFAEIAEKLLDFVRGAEIIAHNAEFDVGFIDAELGLAGATLGRLTDHAVVLDTLSLAREKFPGQRNSLDALCRRFGIDNSHREWHGALLDAQLLAEVYVAMTAGQGLLGFGEETGEQVAQVAVSERLVTVRPRVLHALAAELAAHAARLDAIDAASKGACVWKRIEIVARPVEAELSAVD
jgi:DNA polymerase III subunit epsilon